jgi:hypothetical protein
MPAVTLATLTATNVKPVGSPTAASCVAGSQRISTVQGPLRVEYNWYQQGSGDDFAATDTFVTGVQSPLFATVHATGRADNLGVDSSAEIEAKSSESTYQTVTIRAVDGQNNLGILVTVYGF